MAARRDAAQARLNIRAGTQSIPSSPVRGTRVFATGQHRSIKQLVEAASDREEAASVGVSEGKDQNLNVYRLRGRTTGEHIYLFQNPAGKQRKK